MFPHRRILLVDDDLDAVESMRLLLEISGHEVYGVYDGASAIEAAPRLAPDMALIDIGLPGVGGHEVAKQIRRDRNGDKIVLAALTGYGTDEDRKQSREAGFDYHLAKPLAFDDLQSLLSNTTLKQRTGH